MPLSIPVPTAANATQEISLGGSKYNFLFTFNSRNKRRYLSIYDKSGLVISNLKLIENQLLLQSYNLKRFNHGDVFCCRIKKDATEAGRYNIGQNLTYELLYYTNKEIEDIINGETIS